MAEIDQKGLPDWVWGLVFSASQCALQYNESYVPAGVWQAWNSYLDGDAGQQQVVLNFLRSCKPIEAHHFLHCVGHYEEQTAEWRVVLRRPDCDQATALAYVAWFWTNYEPGPPEWLEADVQELMSYVRQRAWSGGFKVYGFDLPEGALLEMEEMRKTLVERKDHPFSLPPNFMVMSRKEALYYKLRDKFLPRRQSAN